MRHCRQIRHRALDRLCAHTGTGRQCTDAIEAGVGADGLACILYTGMGSGDLERAKSGMALPM